MSSHSMRSSLGKARGLGSARSGVSHWWMQRLTALGLIPLVIYVLSCFILNTAADYETAREWVKHPFNATSLLLLFAGGFFHASLGLQVIIEDYISGETKRLLSLIAVKLVMTALGVLSLFSVLAIALS